MPVSRYCIAKGHVSEHVLPDTGSLGVHAKLFVDIGEGRCISVAINVAPQPGSTELLFWNYNPFNTAKLMRELNETPFGLQVSDEGRFPGLDYIRGELLELNDAIIVSSRDSVVADALSKATTRSTSQHCIAHVYGSFLNESVHNVHMNQGSRSQFHHENGVFQDGGVLLKFPDGHWETIFVAFSSQALETDTQGRAVGSTLREAYTAISAPDTTQSRAHTAVLTRGEPTLGINASDVVFQKTTSCRLEFERCLEFQSLSGGDFLNITFGQFRWWSVAISAEKSGRSSLDHRIRGRPDIRSALIRFLDIMQVALQTCVQLDALARSGGDAEEIGIIRDPNVSASRHDMYDHTYLPPPSHSRLGEQFSYIKISVDYLTKISAAILQSGTRFRHQRADDELESRKEQLQEFRERLLIMIQIERYKAAQSKETSLKDISANLKMDCTLDPAQKRLIEANLIRRNRFDVYFRDFKQKKDSEVKRTNNAHAPGPGQTRTQAPGNNSTKPKLSACSASGRDKQHGPQRAAPPSSREATGVGSSLRVSKIGTTVQKRSPGSVLSRIAQAQDYPMCPSDGGKTGGFWCPYCAQPLDSTHAGHNNRNKWRSHVKEDVAPYICVYPTCSKPTSECMYVHSEEWKQHLRDHHSEPCWVCDFCDDDAPSVDLAQFRTQEEWVDHVKTLHSQELIDDAELADIERASRTSGLFPVDCPVCGVQGNPLDSDKFNHIASHLHSFALLSLPEKLGDESGPDQDSVGSQVALHTSLDTAQDTAMFYDAQDLFELVSSITQLLKEVVMGSGHTQDLRGCIEPIQAIDAQLRCIKNIAPPKSIFFQLEVLGELLDSLLGIDIAKEPVYYQQVESLIRTAADELEGITLSGRSLEEETPDIESSQEFTSRLNTDKEAEAAMTSDEKQKRTQELVGGWSKATTDTTTGEPQHEVGETPSEHTVVHGAMEEVSHSLVHDQQVEVDNQLHTTSSTGTDSPTVVHASIQDHADQRHGPDEERIMEIRKDLGITDPRVQLCFDRGNSFFGEDVPVPSEPPPNVTGYRHQNWNDIVISISDELYQSAVGPEWGTDGTVFLPRQRFRTIVTPERMGGIVAGLRPSFSDHELETFVQAAFHGGLHKDKYRKPSTKLMAALICSGAVDKYLDLVYQGVSDVCLPPVYDKNDFTQPLRCQSLECNTSHMFLGNISIKERREFHAWAYSLNAPYFKKHSPDVSTQVVHHHYMFNNNDVLPIMSSSMGESGTSTNQGARSNSRTTSISQGVNEGGFSRVTRVELHSEHYEFGSHDGKRNQFFALKKLHSLDRAGFDKELTSLLSFSSHSNENLIQVLASFEVQDSRRHTSRYYLLFPWADGTLWDFWQLNDAIDRRVNLSQWMSNQCYRLATALDIFHNERKQQLKDTSTTSVSQELYGRHGDIKAENILWFKEQSQLVLNDFGLARLHSKISRSAQDPLTLARTETYRAPEFDMPGGKITRSSDIFSLGCAFLEFATWFVEGFHSVDVEFVDARSEVDPHFPELTVDTFFRIEERSGRKVSVIKPQITDWIQRLRNNPNCSQYIADFLELIEHHMLNPDPKERYESGRVVKRLLLLRESCRLDTVYWKEPIGEPRHEDHSEGTPGKSPGFAPVILDDDMMVDESEPISDSTSGMKIGEIGAEAETEAVPLTRSSEVSTAEGATGSETDHEKEALSRS